MFFDEITPVLRAFMTMLVEADKVRTHIVAYFSFAQYDLPFRWLKQHLSSKYEIDCRSVSQFFKDVWPDRDFAGGNKNRSLVLAD